jgi:hypothetical protein
MAKQKAKTVSECRLKEIDPAEYLLYKKIADAALGGLDLNNEVIYAKYLELMSKLRERIDNELCDITEEKIDLLKNRSTPFYNKFVDEKEKVVE